MPILIYHNSNPSPILADARNTAPRAPQYRVPLNIRQPGAAGGGEPPLATGAQRVRLRRAMYSRARSVHCFAWTGSVAAVA
jgi:hypothetical protein